MTENDEPLFAEAERALVTPTDPDGMRASWREISSRWGALIERARQLPEPTLHASVNGEWSFVQTLRHLVFAIDKWFVVPFLNGAFSPLGLPNSGSSDFPWPGLDRDANPSFAETLAVWRDRGERVERSLADLDPSILTETVVVLENGNAPIQECVHTIFEEALAHLGYAARDLDALTA